MFEYFTLIRLGHRLPTFPIAVYPERRSKPFEIESYREELFGHELLNFNYFHIGLPGLRVNDYWSDDNPVSRAFSSLMDRGDEDKIQQMTECYHRIYQSELEDDEKILLLYFIHTYYQLNLKNPISFVSG